MRKPVLVLIILLASINLTACNPETVEDRQAMAAEIKQAVATVPGVTEAQVGVTRANNIASLSIRCWVTSSATSKEELHVVLEEVARTIYTSLGEIKKGMLSISVKNKIDEVTEDDLEGVSSTIQGLRRYFEE